MKRTIYTPNEIIIHENECEMYLYDKKGRYIASTYFDLKCLNKVKKYKWSLELRKHTNYARTNIKNIKNKYITVRLHQLILPCKKGYEPDHRDHDGLNNRLSNLRRVTHRKNMENIKSNTSGYVGVSWHKSTKKWRSYIEYRTEYIHLGLFNTLARALKVRENFKLKHNLK